MTKRTLFLDIETRAAVVSTWGLFNQNIGINQVQVPTSMISFAAKWADSKKVEFYSVFHNGQEEMVRQAHRLLDECDELVTWNGKSFDEPHLNREFVLAGLEPPSPYFSTDMYLSVRKRFKFLSNKLQWVSTQLGFEGKVGHEGYGLWEKCLAGDDAAWRKMATYNKRDVTLLQDLYERLLPWITVPNANLWSTDVVCSKCMKSGTLQRRGTRKKLTGEYQQYQCMKERGGCGGWSTDTHRISSTSIVAA